MIAKRIKKRATPNIVSKTIAETTGAGVPPPVFRVIVLTGPNPPIGPWTWPWYDTDAV